MVATALNWALSPIMKLQSANLSGMLNKKNRTTKTVSLSSSWTWLTITQSLLIRARLKTLLLRFSWNRPIWEVMLSIGLGWEVLKVVICRSPELQKLILHLTLWWRWFRWAMVKLQLSSMQRKIMLVNWMNCAWNLMSQVLSGWTNTTWTACCKLRKKTKPFSRLQKAQPNRTCGTKLLTKRLMLSERIHCLMAQWQMPRPNMKKPRLYGEKRTVNWKRPSPIWNMPNQK